MYGESTIEVVCNEPTQKYKVMTSAIEVVCSGPPQNYIVSADVKWAPIDYDIVSVDASF